MKKLEEKKGVVDEEVKDSDDDEDDEEDGEVDEVKVDESK